MLDYYIYIIWSDEKRFIKNLLKKISGRPK